MLVIVEKSFGRQILVDVVKMQDHMNPTKPIGFQVEESSINYVRMPYGPYGIAVMATHTFDLVVFLDRSKVVERWYLEANNPHCIDRGQNGKPLLFLPPDTKPQYLLEDAGQPIEGSTLSEFTSIIGAEPQVGGGPGLVTVFVRLSHVKPDYGPELAPDAFSRVVFQFNQPSDHMKAVTAHFAQMIAAPELPPGVSELITDDDKAGPSLQVTRTCCIAADRYR